MSRRQAPKRYVPATLTPRARIFALFSVAQEHDQPDNNLVAFWSAKPSIDVIAQTVGKTFPAADDETTLAIVKIWNGECQTIDTTDYRLQEVEEGELLA